MMALLLGENKGADMKVFADSLELDQVGFLTQLLLFAAEGDYGVIEELYMHVANRWNALTPDERRTAAGRGEERFFTQAAREHYDQEARMTQKIAVDEGLLQGSDDDKPS